MKADDPTHDYLFDVKLFASVRVRAPSAAAARAMIEAIDASTANFGSWPNGDPIVCEVSAFENAAGGTLRPVEIDGEAV